MKYLKVVSFITLAAIFVGWVYLLYRFEFKGAFRSRKCGERWRSTSDTHCQKLYDDAPDIYDAKHPGGSVAKNVVGRNPNATFVTDAVKYVASKLMYGDPKEEPGPISPSPTPTLTPSSC